MSESDKLPIVGLTGIPAMEAEMRDRVADARRAGFSAGLEAAAKAIEPQDAKPCDCISLHDDKWWIPSCDCRNGGDSDRAAQWCESMNNANTIRAIQQKEESDDR